MTTTAIFNKTFSRLFAPVAQRIEYQPPKLVVRVRFTPGAQVIMKIIAILVPYHLGRQGIGSAKGPLRYRKKGMLSFATAQETISTKTKNLKNEIAVIAKVNIDLAKRVQQAVKKSLLPIVVSGNCNTALGMMAGLRKKTGVIWFDSHGDFNTPETTPSGYFDGMPLAILTGHCHQNLRKKIGLSKPLSESDVLLIGLQSLDPLEKPALKKSAIQVASLAAIRKKGIQKILLPKIRRLKKRVHTIYLHFDIDTLHPSLAPGVDYRCADGLTLKEVKKAFGLISRHFPISAISLTCYNPDKDIGDKTLKNGVRLLKNICHFN